MIEHEAEIYARPARTWFQTAKQKKATADLARLAEVPQGPPQPGSGKSKKQKNEEKRARKKEDDRALRKKSNVLMEVRPPLPWCWREQRPSSRFMAAVGCFFAGAWLAPQPGKHVHWRSALSAADFIEVAAVQETRNVLGAVRKAKAREGHLRQEGMAPTKAGKVAAAAASGAKPSKKKRKKPAPASAQSGYDHRYAWGACQSWFVRPECVSWGCVTLPCQVPPGGAAAAGRVGQRVDCSQGTAPSAAAVPPRCMPAALRAACQRSPRPPLCQKHSWHASSVAARERAPSRARPSTSAGTRVPMQTDLLRLSMRAICPLGERGYYYGITCSVRAVRQLRHQSAWRKFAFGS